MNSGQRGQLGWLAVLAVFGLAGVAMAQSFVWPPTRDAAAQPQASQPTTPAAQMAAERQLQSPVPVPQAGGPAQPVAAVRSVPIEPAAGGRLDWRVLDNTNGPHVAMIFDPVRQVFAVYHVDSASGQIMLKSVRNLSADLRLDQFNSSNPAPKDIQSMLDEAR